MEFKHKKKDMHMFDAADQKTGEYFDKPARERLFIRALGSKSVRLYQQAADKTITQPPKIFFSILFCTSWSASLWNQGSRCGIKQGIAHAPYTFVGFYALWTHCMYTIPTEPSTLR